MFEHFTDGARRVIVLAHEEARLLAQNNVGTEHLLLGLIHEEDGVATRVLASFGITLTDARSDVEARVGRGDRPTSRQFPFSSRMKTALDLSMREALRLGDSYVGTEHLLLGLIREGTGVGARILQDRELGSEVVSQAVHARLTRSATSAAGSTGAGHRPRHPSEVLATAIGYASAERLQQAARLSATAIAELPIAQRLEALGQVQVMVLRGMADQKEKLAAMGVVDPVAPPTEE